MNEKKLDLLDESLKDSNVVGIRYFTLFAYENYFVECDNLISEFSNKYSEIRNDLLKSLSKKYEGVK